MADLCVNKLFFGLCPLHSPDFFLNLTLLSFQEQIDLSKGSRVGLLMINTFELRLIFAFFTGFMILQLLFVILLMPETKGVSLEELRRRLIGKN